MDDASIAPDQVLNQRFAVDRHRHGLTNSQFRSRLKIATARSVKADVACAHGARLKRGKAWEVADLIDMVSADVSGDVDTACKQLSNLGLNVGDLTHNHGCSLRFTLRAAPSVVRVPDELVFFGRSDRRDFHRAGADWRLVHAFWANFSVIFVRVDCHRT